MAGIFDFVQRVRLALSPPTPPKVPDALRIGILGAAHIAPPALILPARSHPGVVVAAVAARDESRARKFAKQHGIEKVFANYQEMLDDPSIDAVYNPLPNGLHYEWTMKAIQAGKHVLLEKPSCNTAEEAERLFEAARDKGVVVLEAFHYRFHPAVHRLREIIQSGELGKIQSLEAELSTPRGIIAKDDIRFQYNLGGGALMDMGTYPLSVVRFLTSGGPTVASAHATPALNDPTRVDLGMPATLSFPNDVTASIKCNMGLPLTTMAGLSVSVKGDKGEAKLFNFVMPVFYHYITVKTKDGKSRTEKVYAPPKEGEQWKGWPKAEPWWSTYRYQLEAFTARCKGQQPHHWMEGDDSVNQMKVIDAIYEKAGLGLRPTSSYLAPAS